MNNIKERFILIFIGLFTTILLLEVGLRFAGSIYLKKTAFDKSALVSDRDYHYTILCLGDSFTYGLGSPRGKDYPSQLEELFNSKVKKGSVKVFNRGLGGNNTTQQLKIFQDSIAVIKPDVVIFLAGTNNFWNYHGYYTYLKGKNVFSKLHNQLYRIRVYKLIKILFLNIKEGIKRGFSKRDKLAIKNVQSRGIVAGDDIKEGVYEESINWGKENVRIELDNSATYYKRGMYFLGRHMFEEAIKMFKEGIRINSDDSNNYYEIGRVYLEQAQLEEAIRWFKEAIKINPTHDLCYHSLGVAYTRLGNQKEALNWFKKAIIANPRSNYDPFVAICKQKGEYDEAIQFLSEVAGSEAVEYLEMLKNKDNIDKTIESWIESDIKRLIQLCREDKIELILQNYPGVESVISQILKNIAKKHSVLFVDQNQIFKELGKKGEKRESYHAPDGHCSAKGYGLMARNIYDKIIKEKIFNFGDEK